jgi:hypothetical protein
MVGMRFDVERLAGVAGRTLGVIEPTSEATAPLVSVALGVGIVTAGAGHPAVDVAIRPQVSFLIAEGPYPTVGVVSSVAELRESQRVIVLDGKSAEVAAADAVLECVASEAHP